MEFVTGLLIGIILMALAHRRALAIRLRVALWLRDGLVEPGVS